MTYAAETSVPVHRSRGELLELLEKHGAESVGFQTSTTGATVTFHAGDRWIRFRLVFATPDSFRKTPAGQTRSPSAAEEARGKHVRSRWRALILVVKAKLESVEAGIEEWDQAFLAHIVLPDDSTVFEASRPAIAASYRDGHVRPLLELEP